MFLFKRKKNKKTDINISEEIEKLNMNKDYLEGLNAGWKLAEKVTKALRNGGYSNDALQSIFLDKKIRHNYDLFSKCSPQEVLVLLKRYDETHKVSIGDIVKDEIENEAIISYIGNDSQITVIYSDGSSGTKDLSHYTKTGKHSDVASFLNQNQGKE